MMPTLVLILTLLGILGVSGLLWACFLRLGLAWAKASGVTTRAVAWATVLAFVLQCTYAAVSYFVSMAGIVPASVHGVADVVIAILISCGVIKHVFKLMVSQALKAWLVTLLSPIAMLPVLFLVVRPFVFEAYLIPTNAMAPTLLGRHWQDACPTCGGPAFSTPLPDDGYSSSRSMICRDHFHITSLTEPGGEVFGGDRILVARFLQPRRWDIIVFRLPEDPTQTYAMRLVGLPGEEITIADGRISANGQLLAIPDSLGGIEFRAELDRGFGTLWGAPSRPARLGSDEYFVLGDFTTQSRDSRFWQADAAGHQPFAVPVDNLLGVVTHIYWPLGRWRTLR